MLKVDFEGARCEASGCGNYMGIILEPLYFGSCGDEVTTVLHSACLDLFMSAYKNGWE